MRSRRFLGTARWGTGENNDDDDDNDDVEDDVDVEHGFDEGNHGDGNNGRTNISITDQSAIVIVICIVVGMI